MTEAPFDVAHCESLAARAAAGDADARKSLIEKLWPAWIAMVRSSPSMGSLASSEDHVRNVAAELVERFEKKEGHTLRLCALWLERHPGKTFLDWIRIVTANAVRSYVTGQLGPRKPSTNEPSAKRLLNEFASSSLLDELGVRPKFTAAQTAREILEFAGKHLLPAQLRVLSLWLDGTDFDEIATQLGLDSAGVVRLQRAAVAQLRRHFGPSADPTKAAREK